MRAHIDQQQTETNYSFFQFALFDYVNFFDLTMNHEIENATTNLHCTVTQRQKPLMIDFYCWIEMISLSFDCVYLNNYALNIEQMQINSLSLDVGITSVHCILSGYATTNNNVIVRSSHVESQIKYSHIIMSSWMVWWDDSLCLAHLVCK